MAVQGVSRHEPAGLGVVVSGAQVIEAEVGIVLLASVEIVVGSRSTYRPHVAVGIVFILARHGSGGVGQLPHIPAAIIAFFNNDVARFKVSAGKITTLEISLVYQAESKWSILSKFTMFLPDLKVRVLEDGTPTGEELVISQRTAKSVAWGDYHGPLKF